MKKLFLGVSFVLAASPVFAASVCSDLFASKPELIKPARIDKQFAASYDAPNIIALGKLNKFIEAQPSFAENKNLITSVRNLLADESLSTFHVLLDLVITKTTDKLKPNQPNQILIDAVIKNLASELARFMPRKMANERANLIKKIDIGDSQLMQALGNMTQKESYEALVGPNGINKISSDSLVGRYIREAKRAGIDVKTLVDSFNNGPGYRNTRGENKLFISADARTNALVNKIFGNNPHLLAHNHTPRQGTLYMHYLGKNVSYATYNRADNLGSRQGSIVPIVVLSSIEGSNTHNYFTLGTIQNKFAKYPWGLRDAKEDSYCRTGGYTSCTHWIGEAPIGEKFVDTYAFPGVYDQHATSRSFNNEIDTGKELRVGRVGTYTHFTSNSTTTEIGTTSRIDRLTRIVWTGTQGRQQLWDMVGDKNAKALSRGEWANPGWVVYSFMSKTTEERVPVVLLITEDASQPLTREVIDSFRTRIGQY